MQGRIYAKPKRPLSLEDIAARIELIESVKRDNEDAHSQEDELWHDVLEAIANGEATSPQEFARAALATKNIKFVRWYA